MDATVIGLSVAGSALKCPSSRDCDPALIGINGSIEMEAAMAYKDLTPKQQRFVDEYIVDLNAKRAAIRAGYSEKTAEVQGCRLLSYAKVQEAVRERTEERKKDTIATAEEVLEYLSSCLRDEYMNTTHRQKAAELLGKRYGLFTDRLNVEEDGEIKVRVTIDGA